MVAMLLRATLAAAAAGAARAEETPSGAHWPPGSKQAARHSLKLDDSAAPFADDPKAAAHAIASKIISHPDAPSSKGDEFERWGYGQSIIIDAMMMAAERLSEPFMTVKHDGGSETVMTGWVNPLLTGFLKAGQPASYLAAGTIPPTTSADKAIGDHIGLFPHAYLHRATYYAKANASRPVPPGYSAATDIKVARTTVDDFILRWPIRWKDGTITRDTPGEGMDAIGCAGSPEHFLTSLNCLSDELLWVMQGSTRRNTSSCGATMPTWG